MRTKNRLSAIFLTVFLSVCWFGFTAAAAEENTEEVGFTLMQNWADGGDLGELKVFDMYFSRDVLMYSDTGDPIGYGMIDQAAFSYLQNYFLINGVSMAYINENTDASGYDFYTFPSTLGGIYAVPIVIYCAEANHMQIRVHKQYLTDSGAGETFTFAVREGFYADARTVDAEENAYTSVRYVLSETVTFTKDDNDEWSCDHELVPYEAPEEIIERADVDFSAIDYERIYASSVSDIIVYDAASGSEYLVLYFDRPVSNQYIPYASAGKQFLSSSGANGGFGITLTQEQIDSLFDYRLDISLNDYIKIDGKTIREMKKQEPVGADSRVYLCWSGSSSDPRSVTFYISGDAASWLDPSERHSLEVTEGFTTPLFGKIGATQTFYFDPETSSWSETDYASLEAPVYDWSPQAAERDAGWNGIWTAVVIIAAVAVVAVAAGVAAALIKKKHRQEGEK